MAVSISSQPETTLRRVDGTAVYLFSQRGLVPPSMLANMRANGSLHESVFVVTIVTDDRPTVLPARRMESVIHAAGITEVVLHYGFMERTTVARDLELHLSIDPKYAYYFLGRETVQSSDRDGMARWREHLFSLMNRNAADVGAYFELPQERTIEIGSRVDI